MNGINVDVWAVEQAAENIASYLTGITTLSNEIKRIETLVSESWKGDYVGEYIECLESTRKKVENMGDVLFNVKTSLTDIADAVKIKEKELRDLMDSGGCGSW